jgi:PAS domain S-box-containing protein
MKRIGKKKAPASAPKRKRAGETLLNDRAITGRKRAEEELRESEEQYRQLFENSMLAISQASLDGRFLRVNMAYARMYGYASPEQMIADVTDIKHQRYANREDRKDVLRILSEKGVMGPREIAMVRRNGTRFTVEVLAQEIRDVSGRFLCYQASHIDITERKRAQEALREAHQFNEQIIRGANEGVIVYGRDLRYEIWNPYMEQLTGLPASDVLGRSPLEVFPFLRDTGVIETIVKALAGGTPAPRDFPFHVPQTGRSGWTEDRTAPLRNADGAVVGAVGMVRDITAWKLAETQARDFSRKLLTVREEEKRHFSAVLHHDVGSCTVGVTARLLAAEEDLRQGKYREALASLKEGRRLFVQSARRLKTLAAELRPPDLDILGLSAALRQHFSLLTRETSIRIRFVDATCGTAIPPEAQTVLFRMAQEALNNVILHARARLVRVRVSASRKTLRLSIIDDGKGFDPVRAAAKPGAHLGLRAAREMVETLGGRLMVHSAPGLGTTVLVTLPQETAQP